MSAKVRVLCIGGLDPSGGAGILADAEAVRAAGGQALAAATAITVQTCRGVSRVVALSPALVAEQVERLFADEAPDAVKLGMLGNARIARALSDVLSRRLGKRPLVIDPVLLATSGTSLFAGHALRDYAALFALSAAVTPNLPEAEKLLGARIGPSRPARERAGCELASLLHSAVILKGGQARGAADDLVCEGDRVTWLDSNRVPGTRRGTGCRFASALATRLAARDPLVKAARTAKAVVRRYLTA